MKLKVFAIHDAKVMAYLHPFFMVNRGTAIRTLTETVRDPKTQFAKFPEDYTLFELGEYDDSNGMVEPLQTPLPVVKIIELVQERSTFNNA